MVVFNAVVFVCFINLCWIFFIRCDIFLGSKVTSFFKFTVCFIDFAETQLMVASLNPILVEFSKILSQSISCMY